MRGRVGYFLHRYYKLLYIYDIRIPYMYPHLSGNV